MNDHNVSKAAVIVIDVQTGVFETIPPPLDKQNVFVNINQITTSARDAGAPAPLGVRGPRPTFGVR